MRDVGVATIQVRERERDRGTGPGPTTIARRHCHKLKMRKYMKFNKNKRPAELTQAAAQPNQQRKYKKR